MVGLDAMDPGQRKRLADIGEKLGVALFAGAVIQAILTEPTALLIVSRILVALFGLVFLVIAVHLSKAS